MASPNITLSVDSVVITRNFNLGYIPTETNCFVGTIEDIGSGVVAEWDVGDNVFYKNSYEFKDDTASWDVVNKADILFKINPV